MVPHVSRIPSLERIHSQPRKEFPSSFMSDLPISQIFIMFWPKVTGAQSNWSIKNNVFSTERNSFNSWIY